MIPIRKLLNLGILDPNEGPFAKRCNKFFDFIMLLVMFWLPIQWYLEYIGELTPQFIYSMNWIVWFLFAIEALVMTIFVKRKLNYLASNWLNLIIIIAVFPPLWDQGSTYFALLRYVRFIVLIRLLLPQLYHLHRILSRNRFGWTLFIFLTVTILSGVLITFIDPGIGSLTNGIWWAWQTVTTVGYGDTIPNTSAGKIFAMLLMIIGVGLYSLVAANLAAYFIERAHRQKVKKPERKVQSQFREVNERLGKMEELNKTLINKLDEVISNQNEPPKDEGS